MSNTIELMINQAKDMLSHAYVPYSRYPVASCLCSEDNNLYTGVNVENTSYGLSVCAETSAICQMISAGRQKIKSMVVLNGENTFCSPCGACRQRIVEFSTPETIIHLCNQQSVIQSIPVHQLLPYAFQFKP
ncbi:cytidine deaminase [Legionella fairfieldensis]|uniref:cytidine deaminase n=1 Tax=Legionella fairfieldensis TaxID=45064 RepID=UPI00048F30AC|nr:cytidine deaminase [Legionella fairfieldensis]